jgi:hypothetical protein
LSPGAAEEEAEEEEAEEAAEAAAESEEKVPSGLAPPAAAFALCAVRVDVAGLTLLAPPAPGAAWELRVWLLPPGADAAAAAVASCNVRLGHALLLREASAAELELGENSGGGSGSLNLVSLELHPLLKPDPTQPSQKLLFCNGNDDDDDDDDDGRAGAASVLVADAHCLAVCAVSVLFKVPAPLLWSAEAPHCYSCVASVAPVATPRAGGGGSGWPSPRRSPRLPPDASPPPSAAWDALGHVEGCRVGLREVAVLSAHDAGLAVDAAPGGEGPPLGTHQVHVLFVGTCIH